MQQEIRVLLLGPYSLCVEATSIIALCSTQVTMATIGLALCIPLPTPVTWISIVVVPVRRVTTTGATVILSAAQYQGRDQGLFVAPLYFNRAGLVNSDAVNNPGYSGYFWSSTVYSSSYAYFLSFSSTYVAPANYSNRYYGRAVRCLAAA